MLLRTCSSEVPVLMLMRDHLAVYLFNHLYLSNSNSHGHSHQVLRALCNKELNHDNKVSNFHQSLRTPSCHRSLRTLSLTLRTPLIMQTLRTSSH